MYLKNAIFKKTEGKKVPIWFMRQAGRFLPEYREIRKNHRNFFDMCFNSEVACEITLMPIKRFDLDGVIMFSDILVLPKIMGIDVSFQEGVGPIINFDPIFFVKNYSYIKNDFAITSKVLFLIKTNIDKNKTLIGFAGGVFTTLAYLLEGGKSYNFTKTKKFINEQKELFRKMIDILTKNTIDYLEKQIESGADVVKIFESHCSFLSHKDFLDFVIKPSIAIVSYIKNKYPDIPIIGFPMGSGVKYLNYMNDVKPDCLAIDYTVPLDWIEDNISKHTCVQGNLDPFLLAYDIKEAQNSTISILDKLSSERFIFNTGHGVLPDTPVDNVLKIIDVVRGYDKN